MSDSTRDIFATTPSRSASPAHSALSSVRRDKKSQEYRLENADGAQLRQRAEMSVAVVDIMTQLHAENQRQRDQLAERDAQIRQLQRALAGRDRFLLPLEMSNSSRGIFATSSSNSDVTAAPSALSSVRRDKNDHLENVEGAEIRKRAETNAAFTDMITQLHAENQRLRDQLAERDAQNRQLQRALARRNAERRESPPRAGAARAPSSDDDQSN